MVNKPPKQGGFFFGSMEWVRVLGWLPKLKVLWVQHALLAHQYNLQHHHHHQHVLHNNSVTNLSWPGQWRPVRHLLKQAQVSCWAKCAQILPAGHWSQLENTRCMSLLLAFVILPRSHCGRLKSFECRIQIWHRPVERSEVKLWSNYSSANLEW